MTMKRRTKIICTLGPACDSPQAIRALVDAGMDVARLNFSHGSREEHAEVYGRVREASDAAGRAVGILADLQGPKIRLGCFEGGSAFLEPGSLFTVSTEPSEGHGGFGFSSGSSGGACTTYGGLARDVSAGDTLLIDDGLIKLSALSTDGREVQCRVVEGGLVSDHKGISLPRMNMDNPILTEKDIDDLRLALALGVDMVALSFVRSPADVLAVREVMDAAGRRVPVIAKVERPEAVNDLEAVVAAFDGLMVARGDLGVEMPLEQVPMVQKRAVKLARQAGKPVIVATEMLQSMILQPRPTRAEASDVANAVLDGADALMLSAETSVGLHPLAVVATMARIITTTEEHGLDALPPSVMSASSPPQAVAQAATSVGHAVDATALVAFTQTGMVARHLASHRSTLPLLAFTPEPAVRSQLCLTWGVETFVLPVARHTDDMVAQVDRTMLELGRGHRGDRIVVIVGSLPGKTGGTNMIRVHELGSEPASYGPGG